ncbi:MAG: rubredoxin [Methanomassiliicoccales archaeon]|nr:rubredoxin [Methanomassiliicoccales archaeon]
MMPIAPLMIEHRTIERMAVVMAEQAERSGGGEELDIRFIPAVVDFMRNYADRTHHGKEEDILFRALKDRPLSDEHRFHLERLEGEHVKARGMVSLLRTLGDSHAMGDPTAAYQASMLMRDLAELYQQHIALEDRSFFVPVMEYFTAEESEVMLAEFKDFDSRMIHERYAKLVEGMGGGEPMRLSHEEGRWRCRVCGFIYDQREGDPRAGVPPGTPFQDLPEDWVCPVCEAGKDAFEHL